MAQNTTRYHFIKPALSEKADVRIINTNMDAIDSALAAESDKIQSHISAWNHCKVEKSETNGNIKIDGTETNVYTHPPGTNPHGTTKSDIGLENVDNTSDLDKPVSVAQQNAFDTQYEHLTAYTDQKIADLIAGTQETLDAVKIAIKHSSINAVAGQTVSARTQLGSPHFLSSDKYAVFVAPLTAYPTAFQISITKEASYFDVHVQSTWTGAVLVQTLIVWKKSDEIKM